MTVFFDSSGGGFGSLLRRSWYVDGRRFAEIKGDERVTIELPEGKHSLRNAGASSQVINVQGPLVLTFNETGFAEVLPDRDPTVRAQLEQTKPIQAVP